MDSIYLGTIIAWPITFTPQCFAFCGGQLLPVSENQALYSVLGFSWGGNGSSNFALPDLRGRVIVGNTGMSALPLPTGVSPHLFNPKGNASQLGVETVTLTASQVPLITHSHSAVTTVSQGSLSFTLPALSGTGQLKATAQPGSTNIPGSNAVPAQIEPLQGSGDTVNAYGSPDATTTMPVTVSIPAPADPIPVSGSLGVTVGINPTGSSAAAAVPILQPYAVMNYLICTSGLYPTRN